MTVLYVDGLLAPVNLELDGPSLLLMREGQAPDRAPLRRLTRLVLRGPVRLGGAVMPALLRAGISVSWIDGQGHRLGSCVPVRLPRTDTRALVEEALRSPRFSQLRENWLLAEERQLLLDLVIELGLRPPDLRRSTIERLVLQLLTRAGAPLDAEEILRRFRSLLEAHLALLLAREGLGFRFQGGDPEGWNLLADLAHVDILALAPTALDLALYVAKHPERHDTAARTQRRFVRRYERVAGEIEALVLRQLARLRRLFRESLE